MSVSIPISEHGLERASKILASLSTDTSRVTARVINRVVAGMKTDAASETSKRYFVKAADVRASITPKNATSGNLLGEITSRGERHNPAYYRLNPKSPTPGKQTGIKGAVKKEGGLKPLTQAFFVKRKGGGYAPFYRAGSGRGNKYKGIKSYISPAIPQIIKNEETVQIMQEKATERFEKRLDHEMMRVIGALP